MESCLNELEGTILVNSWEERGIFYNPNNQLKRGVYILTVKENDGENDSSSKRNREPIYRVNLGIYKDTLKEMFGTTPKRPCKGGMVDMKYDFSITNQIFFHIRYMLEWAGYVYVIHRKRLLKI